MSTEGEGQLLTIDGAPQMLAAAAGGAAADDVGAAAGTAVMG